MARRKKQSHTLTPLELQIMQVLWQVGPSDVQTVQQNLPPETRLAYTTVQTVLNVLQRKGNAKRALKGRAYIYRPVLTKEKAVWQAVGDLVERLFGGSSEDLVMSLIKNRQVDPARLASLAEEVRNWKEGEANE